MIPVLYKANSTNFDTYGIGVLKDCTSCEVTEERNGAFECQFKYPIHGTLYKEITTERLVKAKPNDTAADQVFRIYRISTPINGEVTVYAQHLSYDLLGVAALQWASDSISPSLAMERVFQNTATPHNFTCQTDYSSYFRVQYNGNKFAYLFNTTSTFGWTEYTATIQDVQDGTMIVYAYNRIASLYVSDIILAEGTAIHKWTPAPNEIYTTEVKIDRRGIEVSNADSGQRTVITNQEFSGYYNEEKIFTLNKDETITKKTTVDGELTVGKTKFVPMSTASEGLNIVILD